MRLLWPFLAALAGCGPNFDQSAVTVRWRMIDAVTGTQAARCVGRGAFDTSYCCQNIGGAANPDARDDVAIDRMRLRIETVDAGGGIADFICPRGDCDFGCSSLEHTTQFELPPATYRLSLEAYSCGCRVGRAPVPLTHSFTDNEIVDMNVQSVLLYPSDAELVQADPSDVKKSVVVARCPSGPKTPLPAPQVAPPPTACDLRSPVDMPMSVTDSLGDSAGVD